MIYSYTQISQYLTCPRRYRHRYLDGWQEKDSRAAMLFGRAFERALAAYFLRKDAAAALFQEWKLYQDQKLEYSHGDSWDRSLSKAFNCWTGSARKIASAFASPGAICRSSSCGRFLAKTNSWPTSMPSDGWTISAACSNGRRLRPAIRRNRMDC